MRAMECPFTPVAELQALQVARETLLRSGPGRSWMKGDGRERPIKQAAEHPWNRRVYRRTRPAKASL